MAVQYIKLLRNELREFELELLKGLPLDSITMLSWSEHVAQEFHIETPERKHHAGGFDAGNG